MFNYCLFDCPAQGVGHIDKMPNMVVYVAAHPLVILVECVAIDTLWKYLVQSDLRISYHT